MDPTLGAKKRAWDSGLCLPSPVGIAAVVAPEHATDRPRLPRYGGDIVDLVEPLLHASGWIRGIALIYIIVGGLAGLGGFALLTAGSSASWPRSRGFALETAFGYLVGGALGIYIGTTLYQAAGFIRKSYESEDRGLFLDGLDKIRTYFTVVGIVTLLSILLCAGAGFIAGV